MSSAALFSHVGWIGSLIGGFGAETFPIRIVTVPSVLSATDNPRLHLATGGNREYTF